MDSPTMKLLRLGTVVRTMQSESSVDHLGFNFSWKID